MTAIIIRLQTDAHALWRAHHAARNALVSHPTPARFDACLAAFKPYYIRVVGPSWQEKLAEAMEAERPACTQIMQAASQPVGQSRF